MRRAIALADTLFLSWWRSGDLNRLAALFQTDKWGTHWYTKHYDRYFAPIRWKRLKVLEIGVGGYDSPVTGGHSLRMWKAYFRRSRIVGIDLHDKSALREARIDIRQCDQTDPEGLTRISNEYGGFDIIIDDGSHLNEHVIKTFQILFPLLRPNGIYTIEDTQTSCWPTWGGGRNAAGSLLSYFRGLVEGLNHKEYAVPDYKPSYFDEHIVEMAFFHNLIIIRKGRNDEPSNCPDLIQQELESMKANT